MFEGVVNLLEVLNIPVMVLNMALVLNMLRLCINQGSEYIRLYPWYVPGYIPGTLKVHYAERTIS